MTRLIERCPSEIVSLDPVHLLKLMQIFNISKIIIRLVMGLNYDAILVHDRQVALQIRF